MSEKQLTLRPRAFFRVGDEPFASGKPVGFDVDGLPPGEKAFIARHGGVWKILRTIGGEQGAWIGDYESAEAALAVLEHATEG